jgi:hypothetical protein
MSLLLVDFDYQFQYPYKKTWEIHMARINRFGTTQDMIIQTIEEDGESLFVAIDSNGLYFTTQERIDTGLADTNRYAKDRTYVVEKLEKLGFSPLDMFEENRDKIKLVTTTTKKINPLKASKRGLS